MLRTGLIDSSIWTALTLAALPALAALLLGLPLDPRPCAFIFLSGLMIYNLDHLADSYREVGSRGRWTEGIGRPMLKLLVAVSVLGLAAMIYIGGVPVLLVFLGYGLVGSLYGLPVVPMPTGWRRPKDIPGAKGLIVSGSITVAAIGLPLAFAAPDTLPPLGALLTVAAFLLVFLFSNTVMCDVGDLVEDRLSGVRTLPVLLGVARTRALLVALNLLMAVGFFAAAWVGAMPLRVEGILSVLFVLAYVLRLDERSPKALVSLCLDGCSFAPLFLAYWVHASSG